MGTSRIGRGGVRRFRTFGYIGVFGSLIAVGADIALGYNADGIGVFDTLFSFSVRQVYPLFLDTPHWRLLLSNYLAITGIPLGFLGLLFVHRQFISGNSIWASLFLVLGVIGYLAGTVFHVSLSYIATLLRFEPEMGTPFGKIVELFSSFSSPLAYTFLITLFLVSLLFAYCVLRGWTALPRLYGLVNPLSLQLLLVLVSLTAPPAVKSILIFSIYNLSLAIFYAVIVIGAPVAPGSAKDEQQTRRGLHY